MDPKFKEQQLKNKITYALAIQYVNKYRINNGVNPQNAIQNDQVMLAALVDELMIKFKQCEQGKEITSHHQGIKACLDD